FTLGFMIKDIHEIKKCPSCLSDDIVYNDKDDQIICKECAEIFEPLTPEDEERFEKTHEM
ncbi:hypothetical protein KY334_04035, partial [Candidatus Woesearchaeota archaeon]|nr:hypothetical protein [Candidatus Woesearchaeota archaeon]